MFRELAYITLILSTATFGTEIIFRFKPENQSLGSDYIVQILTLVILAPLIATIALRSKYNFFMPLDDKRFRYNGNRTPSLHRYDDEIDYTLPSYSEVPPPPTYNKVISSDGDIQIDHNDHTLTSTTESSSQNRNSVTTVVQDTPHTNAETISEEAMDRVESSVGVNNNESLDPSHRSDRQ
ncbi:hypothetical protein MUCCIDRAFT_167565 [Mucor lusitanicus CBS 277.49]|uniref:Uncharacterized protein n=1 Tax=Mucor lusitanicus CBS 277.49 TaxID=747725 RepID=A0A168H8E7_MUCCL|nr:hypothetical protein MUCCIDRAFT_167565 [Mucor lusitanicus CBS 277.49]